MPATFGTFKSKMMNAGHGDWSLSREHLAEKKEHPPISGDAQTIDPAPAKNFPNHEDIRLVILDQERT
jgi:hypothetical protein